MKIKKLEGGKIKMAKTGLIILVVIIALIVIAGVLLFNPKTGTETGETGGVSETGGGSEGTGELGEGEGEEVGGEETQPTIETPQPQTYNVEIKSFTFSLETLKIKAGDTVIWTNKDATRHTVTSDSGNELDSELIRNGGSYSHTFTSVGEFAYYCKPHTWMKAKVIVE